jgi:hypothetical protein
VNYREYQYSCGGYSLRPYSLNAPLTKFTYSPHPRFSACKLYTGGTAWKSHGRNVTVSGGVDLGAVNVSAQSGYTSASSMTWVVTQPTQVCGSTRAGWASAPLAEAHAA